MAFRLYVNECGVSHRFWYESFYNKLDIGMPHILYQFEMLLPLPVLLNHIFWVLEALERIVIILEFMLPENDITLFRPKEFSIKQHTMKSGQSIVYVEGPRHRLQFPKKEHRIFCKSTCLGFYSL